MVKIEWNDSIEKSLDIMRQNVSKLSELSNQQYLAFKKRIEYMNLPLAILSGANAGAIFFLEEYSFGHYVNIGCGVASLVYVFTPQLVLLGGGLAGSARHFLPSVRREVESRVQAVSREGLRIEAACLGNGAGRLGAARLALQRLNGMMAPD